MSMTKLYLVRHGETEENASHILQGHLPGHLSLLGIEQVRSLGEELSALHFDVMVCSDLQRCIHSANILNERLRLPMTVTPLLRERDWGGFTGKSIPSIKGVPFPADVESVEAMAERASRFLDYVRTTYPGQSVLAVGHGLMNRVIQSVHYGKPMQDIERMQNATYRLLELE